MLVFASGNAMRNFFVFVSGVSPLHHSFDRRATFAMDLLPKFVEWGKQGEVGREESPIMLTRYIGFGLVQSIGIQPPSTPCPV